jgi:hypothetical protein
MALLTELSQPARMENAGKAQPSLPQRRKKIAAL